MSALIWSLLSPSDINIAVVTMMTCSAVLALIQNRPLYPVAISYGIILPISLRRKLSGSSRLLDKLTEHFESSPPLSCPKPSAVPFFDMHVSCGDIPLPQFSIRQYTTSPTSSSGLFFFVAPSKESTPSVPGRAQPRSTL